MTVLVPRLVTPAASVPVELADMKAHLRVMHDAEDDLIAQLTAGATAYLDGWKGVLGRCIMSQTWQVDAEAGDVILPFPDVSEARADSVVLPVRLSALGPVVSLIEAATVEFDCALPEANLETIKVVVKLLVGHWYENREAVNVGNITSELPMAVDMLVSSLRWRAV